MAYNANNRAGGSINIPSLLKLVVGHLLKECRYCKELLTPKNISLDHIMPISRGGKNDMRNVQVICSVCNERKGKMTDEEYTKLINLIDSFPEEVRKELYGKLRTKRTYF